MTDLVEQMAEKLAYIICGLLNYSGFSRQDAQNVDAVQKEIVSALRSYGEACIKEDLKIYCYCVVSRTYISKRCKGCHGIVETLWGEDVYNKKIAEVHHSALEEAA